MAKHSSPETRITNSRGNNTGDGIALPVGLELGRYRLLRKVGKGGFGITYLAEHKLSHELVVIKENMPTSYAYRDKDSLHVYPLDDGSATTDYAHTLMRFVEEARTLARLNHPNIVRVYEAFEAFGTAYYVMPLVTGKELHKAAPATVDEDWLLPILKSILQALDYLHGENLLHRDIKPNNIILREDGTPILIDFGTARALQSEHSSTMVSTPGYTPIEQITPHGKRGPWTDMYALGATCYRLITGECPPEATERIDDEDIFRPLATRAELKNRFSIDLLRSIDKALALRTKNRWQSAQEWLSELKESPPRSSIPLTIPATVITSTTAQPRTKKSITSGIFPQIFIGLCVELLAALTYSVYAHLNATAPLSVIPKQTEQPDTQQLTESTISPPPDTPVTSQPSTLPINGSVAINVTACNDRETNKISTQDKHLKLWFESMGISDYDTAINEYHDNPEKLRLLITAGTHVNKVDKDGKTPLTLATEYGLTEIVKLLLTNPCVDINQADRKGETPLTVAVIYNQPECLKILLKDPRINVNTTDAHGFSALYNAAKWGNTECIKQLLATPGIDINIGGSNGNTPFHIAAKMGYSECLNLLIAAGGNADQTSKNGTSPLHMAAEAGQPECLRVLIAAGAEINRVNEKGWTPLRLAAVKNNPACIRLLLATPGIDVNLGDFQANTPLFLAAKNGHKGCVKLLLTAPGIDINKTNAQGYTPLKIATENEHTECAELIRAAGGK